MKRIYVAVAVLAVFAFIAYQFLFADRRSRLKVEAMKTLPSTAASFNFSNQKLDNVSNIRGERMLVYQGAIEFEVDSALRVRNAIKKIVKDHGGYVLSERQDDYGGPIHFSQSLRIPSEATDEVVRKIEILAGKIVAKKMSAIDVTEEFIDVESRVLTKKKSEARLQEIITGAKTVEDVIKIEDRIAIIRGEIESMEGRLKYLENQVALGTLDIEFYEHGAAATAGFGSEVISSLKNGWQGLLACIAGIANIWPIIIVSALAVWIYRRRIRKMLADAAN